MYNQTTVTTSYTVGQNIKAVTIANQGNAVTITLPDATKYKDRVIFMSRYSSGDIGNITINATAGLVESPFSNILLSSVVLTQEYKQFCFVSDAIDWHLVVNGISRFVLPNRYTSSTTLSLADSFKFVEVTTAGASSITVPNSSTVYFFPGTIIDIGSGGAGIVSVVAAGGVQINSYGNKLKLAGLYAKAKLHYLGGDLWYLDGELTV